MKNQDPVTSETPQSAPSREELEQYLRARAWKDDAFRQEFLANPKAVLERDYAQYFPKGKLPSKLSIQVIEEDEQAICFVLPPKFSVDQLSQLENIDDEELLATAVGGIWTEVFMLCSMSSSCIAGSQCCERNISAAKVGQKLKGIRL